MWLAAVCAYSILGVPAAARRPGTKRLLQTALGGKAPRKPLEKKSRPVTVDVQPTVTSSPKIRESKKKTDTSKRAVAARQARRQRIRERRSDLAHSLPVAAPRASVEELHAPHHDYPAWDLALPPGTKIYAVTAGRVYDTTKSGACGKGVIIRGEDNFIYTYCHGSKLLVRPGREVNEGKSILRSGNTGDSTGPHLHLQIRRPNGKLVCPQDLLPAWKRGVPKSPWEAKSRGCHTGGHRHRHKGKKR